MKMNISTIYPHTMNNRDLTTIFQDRPVNLYYSIYGINDNFRKHYLPNAMPVKYTLDKLKEFQIRHNSENTLVFHCAFIAGQNDNLEDVQKMADLIKSYNFEHTKFNLVRLNPYINDDKPIMVETDLEKLKQIFNIMNECVTNKVSTQQSRIINRIGPDVFASC
jgi:adenine C2-methylase RlmN of 23S rRNA A2503 and tRNA A37